MANAKTNLALTTVGAIKPKRGTPQKVNATSNNMPYIAQHWQSLSADQKDLWLAATLQKAQSTQTDLPSRLNPYATFLEINSNILNTGGVLQTVPSATYPRPLPLPAFTLDAILGAQLSLNLGSPDGYNGRVILYGAKPVLAGQNVYQKGAFKMLGSLGALTSGDDIAPLYQTRFRVPSAGYKIAIKIVGISAQGLRTSALFVSAVVNGQGGQSSLVLK